MGIFLVLWIFWEIVKQIRRSSLQIPSSDRSNGGLTIMIEKPVVEIPLLASHPDIRKKPVTVKIFLVKDFFKKEKLLDEIILKDSNWKTYEFSISEEVNQEVILRIKVSRTWNPLKTIGTPDPRNLGVALDRIKFKDKI